MQWGKRTRLHSWKHQIASKDVVADWQFDLYRWEKGVDDTIEHDHDDTRFITASGRDPEADRRNQEARHLFNELGKCEVELRLKCRKCPFPRT